MCMSNTLARETVGWTPSVRLREGFELEWKWLQDNPGRWTEMSY